MRQCGGPVVLVAPVVAEMKSATFEYHALMLLALEGVKTPLLLRQVVGVVEDKAEEWMYQMREREARSDPLLEALKIVQNDANARPVVEFTSEPTRLQRWAADMIRDGHVICSYGVTCRSRA
eukprot:TRINITY_DN16221_c0_g1_i1.p1 TRINITY_DN16221_c0_g1~~TRINITY_DN16221_c0_g1_i1.p1  ORF type:complete len:122 (+),score=32.17 TRINITY_DN16221_c0_g1_i1:3-368(+)